MADGGGNPLVEARPHRVRVARETVGETELAKELTNAVVVALLPRQPQRSYATDMMLFLMFVTEFASGCDDGSVQDTVDVAQRLKPPHQLVALSYAFARTRAHFGPDL